MLHRLPMAGDLDLPMQTHTDLKSSRHTNSVNSGSSSSDTELTTNFIAPAGNFIDKDK